MLSAGACLRFVVLDLEGECRKANSSKRRQIKLLREGKDPVEEASRTRRGLVDYERQVNDRCPLPTLATPLGEYNTYDWSVALQKYRVHRTGLEIKQSDIAAEPESEPKRLIPLQPRSNKVQTSRRVTFTLSELSRTRTL